VANPGTNPVNVQIGNAKVLTPVIKAGKIFIILLLVCSAPLLPYKMIFAKTTITVKLLMHIK
jgi:hypothetical protein